MKQSGIDFEEFLKNYKHICYFECIMYPDGTLEEAVPSHIYKMCEIYDNTKSIQEIEKDIPIHLNPIEFLLRKTNCVALWYNNIMIDGRYQQLTEIQKRNIKILNEKRFINLSDKLIEQYDKSYKDYQDFLNSQPEEIRKLILERDCALFYRKEEYKWQIMKR